MFPCKRSFFISMSPCVRVGAIYPRREVRSGLPTQARPEGHALRCGELVALVLQVAGGNGCCGQRLLLTADAPESRGWVFFLRLRRLENRVLLVPIRATKSPLILLVASFNVKCCCFSGGAVAHFDHSRSSFTYLQQACLACFVLVSTP